MTETGAPSGLKRDARKKIRSPSSHKTWLLSAIEWDRGSDDMLWRNRFHDGGQRHGFRVLQRGYRNTRAIDGVACASDLPVQCPNSFRFCVQRNVAGTARLGGTLLHRST
jgi:hypothetical protein